MHKSLSILIILIFSFSCKEKITNTKIINKLPSIIPDYTGVTIPYNIAPLNFTLKGDYDVLDVEFSGKNESALHIQNRGAIAIPVKQWHEFLDINKGDSISVLVHLKKEDLWYQYKPFTLYISSHPIDYGIVYRLIAPGYETYSNMGIYERDLSNFKQRAIIENTQITNSCMNCHTFNQGNPYQQSIHIRGEHGATLIKSNNQIKVLKSKSDSILGSIMYPYWHPSGRYIAYSTNLVRQSFHITPNDLIDSFDENSDILLYDIGNNQLICNNLIAGKAFETYPSFSADGKTMYFCTAEPRQMPQEIKKARYNICSVPFFHETGTFGNKVDTLIHAVSENNSATLPRESHNGRYLMYTMSDYSNFPLYHKDSNLWLLDLQTGIKRSLDEVNSDYAESYHNWSTNSHWFVFGSRREDGMFTRAYIAYMDDNGTAGKPFLLPQENPYEYYQDLFLSYNSMEFVSGKVPFNAKETENLLMSSKRIEMEFIRK